MEIEVYNYPLSPCGEKVRFALAEKGLAFTDRQVDLGAKENLRSDFLAFNPKGLVPVLIDDGTIIADSTVILEYIEDRWPDHPLRPASAIDRARMRRWTKHVDEVLHPAWPGVAWPILVRPKWQQRTESEVEAMLVALPDPRRRERQRRLYDLGLESPDARESLTVLRKTCAEMDETLAEAPCLAGQDYSLADIALLPYFLAIEVFGLDGSLKPYANLRRWYQAACARPCFNGHPRTMIPDDRLAEIAHWLEANTPAPLKREFEASSEYR